MDELSGRAQKLIADAMDEDDPPEDVANTGWSAIAERLSHEEPRAEPGSSSPRQRFPQWLLLPIGVALAAAIAWIVTSVRRDDEPAPIPSRRVVGSADDPRAADPPAVDARPAQTPSEAELVGEAEAALADGEAERALEVLDRHAMRYPTGERADDRLVLRIRALCALDRTTEARAEADSVRRLRPDAPALARLHDTCAAK